MTRMTRTRRTVATGWIAIVAIVALLGPGSLQAQGVNLPSDQARATHGGVKLKSTIDTPQTTALRLSIARETKRLTEPDQNQAKPAGQKSWASRHRAGILSVAIIATIGAIIFALIYNHSGD